MVSPSKKVGTESPQKGEITTHLISDNPSKPILSNKYTNWVNSEIACTIYNKKEVPLPDYTPSEQFKERPKY